VQTESRQWADLVVNFVELAGGNDDQFYADRYAPTLQPAKPDLTVELLPDLDHVDMLVKPAALATLRRTFDAMPR